MVRSGRGREFHRCGAATEKAESETKKQHRRAREKQERKRKKQERRQYPYGSLGLRAVNE